jgi:hypothetical protein
VKEVSERLIAGFGQTTCDSAQAQENLFLNIHAMQLEARCPLSMPARRQRGRQAVHTVPCEKKVPCVTLLDGFTCTPSTCIDVT